MGCGQPTVRRAGWEGAHLPVAQVIGHHKEEVGPGGRRRLGAALWLAAHDDTVEDDANVPLSHVLHAVIEDTV